MRVWFPLGPQLLAEAGTSAANRKERATARPAAATTGDEDATEEDSRTPATTARARKRADNKTQRRDTK